MNSASGDLHLCSWGGDRRPKAKLGCDASFSDKRVLEFSEHGRETRGIRKLGYD